MKPTRKMERITAPTLLGIVALVGSMGIAGWAYSKYPAEMRNNLLAEVSGVLLEIALVVFCR